VSEDPTHSLLPTMTATVTKIPRSFSLLTFAIFAIFCSNPPIASAASPPNIIFILADDLGWQDTGFTGADFYETPHLDKLAASGMTFTAAHSGGPNCAPTRACLMSGTYTPRHQIYTPGGESKGDPRYMRLLVPAKYRKDQKLNKKAKALFTITNNLDPAFVCIPEVLKPAGYTSARIGKWHLGTDTQGFDLSSSNGLKDKPDGSHYGDVDVAEQLTDRAIKFIDEQANLASAAPHPFFVYLTHWDVHTPHRARKDVVAKYEKKLAALGKEKGPGRDPVLAGMIEAVDTSVGRIADKIDELGLAENTLIIFSSDNGGLPGVSDLDPLRGQKGSLFQAGTRVPTCMRWTGTIEPGTTCHTPITSVDFLPTFAALAHTGLPADQPADGTDISPLLTGDTIPDRSIFWHYPLYLQGRGLDITLPDGGTYSWRGFPSTALLKGKYKLVEFHEDDTIALYDLDADPAESKNLADSLPELAAQLRTELDKWQQSTNAPIPSLPNPECVLK
jgi:arylsulfatase A-like enzyme